jgi:hypothetical protein
MHFFRLEIGSRTRHAGRRQNPRSSRRKPLGFESLESRQLLATYTVVNTNDSGAGSLRQALLDAAGSPPGDVIDFDIPGGGAHTIAISTNLPAISGDTLDATTQPGYEVGGLHPIEIRNGGVPHPEIGLWMAGGAMARGLTINGFWAGIFVDGDANRIEGSYIGLNPTGDAVGAETGHVDFFDLHFATSNATGIKLNAATNTVIGGSTPAARNIISGNYQGIGRHDGIPQETRIIGNYIGTDTSGASAVPNFEGVSLTQHVGGFTPEERNVISGNGWGVVNATRVSGNYIGTDVTGMVAVPNVYGVNGGSMIGGTEPGAGNLISGNSYPGIQISGAGAKVQGNWIGTDATGNGVLGNAFAGVFLGDDVQVGGADPAARNIISGNGHGIAIFGNRNTIEGNYIGTNPAGTSAVGNGNGIYLLGTPEGGNVIGGTAPGAGNVISGNSVGIWAYATNGENRIEGNRIGTTPDGLTSLGNHHGITLAGGATNQVIGGFSPGSGNTIAYNNAGVAMILYPNDAPFPRQNQILGNAIFGNTGLGIDLSNTIDANGVTPNDPLDADDGSNGFQNFPVLDSAVSNGVNTIIAGSLESTPNSTFRVEFFANAVADASGHGEGEVYLGFANVTTDAAGQATFTATLPGSLSAGRFVSATATDLVQKNTSEFAASIVSTFARSVTIDILPESVNVDSQGALSVVVFGSAGFDASLIDIASVRFAGAGVWQSTLADVNQDGILDMQLKFRREDTILDEIYAQLLADDLDQDGILDSTRQTAQIDLTGETLEDELFRGSDAITLFLTGKALRTLLDQLVVTQ